jgi:hypothetical protein
MTLIDQLLWLKPEHRRSGMDSAIYPLATYPGKADLYICATLGSAVMGPDKWERTDWWWAHFAGAQVPLESIETYYEPVDMPEIAAAMRAAILDEQRKRARARD